MAQVIRKWIQDSAINNEKIDEADVYSITGLLVDSTSAAGRVGIGVTVPLDALHIQRPDTSAGFMLDLNDGSNGRSYQIYSSSTGVLNIRDIDVGIDRFTLKSTASLGNIGISTADPQDTVHARATTGSSALRLDLDDGVAGQAYKLVSNSAGDFAIVDVDDGSTTRLLIDSTGTMTIPGDTTMGGNFQVNGTVVVINTEIVIADQLEINQTDATQAALIASQDNGGATGTVVKIENAGSGPALTSDAGNVGFGTTNPVAQLHVEGDIVGKVTASASNIGSPTRRIGTIYMASDIDYASNLHFNSTGTKITFDTTNGRVGIGSTLPAQPLDVVGNVASSATIAGNALTATLTVTGGTGVIATTGNVVATAGQVNSGTTMNAGTGITATTGSITAALGNVVATLGNVVALVGNVTAGALVTGTTGVVATTGNVVATAGAVNAATTMTAGTGITATIGNIVATAGQVNAGTTMTAGTGITATTGNIVASAGAVNAGTTMAAGTTMTAGTGITATTGTIAAAGGALTATLTVTGGTGVIATTGNIVATAGQVNAGTTMTAGTGITATTGNIVATTGSITSGTTISAGTSVGSNTYIWSGTFLRSTTNCIIGTALSVGTNLGVTGVSNFTGNVGIGTTAAASESLLVYKADLPQVRIQSDGGSGDQIYFTMYQGSDNVFTLFHANNATKADRITYLYCNDGGRIEFGSGSTGSTKMTLAHSGSVGIGTTNPLDLLHLQSASAGSGRIRIEETGTGGSNTPGLIIYNENSYKGGLFYDESSDEIWLSYSAANGLIVNNSGNVKIIQALEVTGSGTAPVVITSGVTGSIGIGVTSPNERLHVQSATASKGRIRIEEIGTGGGNHPGVVLYNESAYEGGLTYSESADKVEIASAFGGGQVAIEIDSTTNDVTINKDLAVVGDLNVLAGTLVVGSSGVIVSGAILKTATVYPTGSFTCGTNTNRWSVVYGVNGVFSGSISKGSGSFLIDHPLDPKNKVLRHSFIESPEMRNVYYGQDKTINGSVLIALPNWWIALNGADKSEYTYQFTTIGSYSRLYVSKEIENNEFEVTSLDGDCKFSWTVTGIRHDKFAEENRIVVEQEKKEDEKGKLIHV